MRTTRRFLWVAKGVMGAITVAQSQSLPGEAATPVVELDELVEPAFRGEFRIGTTVTRRVPVLSLGDNTVELRVVSTSCPCTVARLRDSVILPGESTVLEIMTTAADVTTRQQYTVEMEAKERSPHGGIGRTQRLSTTIGYGPDLRIIVTPRKIVCVVSPGETRSFDLSIRRQDRREIQFLGAKAPADWVHCDDAKVNDERPWEGRIRMTIRAAQSGRLDGVIDVQAGRAEEKGSIRVIALVEDELSVDPAGAVFVEAPSGSSTDSYEVEFLVPARLRGSRITLETSSPLPEGLSMPGSASLHDDRTKVLLHAKWTGLPPMSGVVHVTCRTDTGQVVGSFPIVWLRRTPQELRSEGSTLRTPAN